MNNNETVLDVTASEKALITIIPPIIGAILGWYIPTILEWIIKLPFIPFQGILEWLATLESNWIPIISTILGGVAGIFFSNFVFHEILKIIVTDEEVKLNIRKSVEIFKKREISSIYMEGKQLVFLNREGMELFRGHPDYKRQLIIEAFKEHHYPWKEEDPFEDEYQRWVPGHPGLPQYVNALLAAREQALIDEETKEAKILRKDLAKLGVVIRDNGKRQYVRMAKR
ncbi:hypothetical protein [Gracilibacillus xinjiangensis]|uniref:50S ribosomal protein L29 n=1 Tax=Gracilibacillus xinjiangensis TaxID=1193282 RepID=A0ABV8WXD5_9BACI